MLESALPTELDKRVSVIQWYSLLNVVWGELFWGGWWRYESIAQNYSVYIDYNLHIRKT